MNEKFTGKYEDLPKEVRDVFTEDEFDTLVKIQDSFYESVSYVNRILRNDDLEQNLYYVVHDWLGERGQDFNRNDALVAELKQISRAYERFQNSKEKLDEQTNKIAEVGK